MQTLSSSVSTLSTTAAIKQLEVIANSTYHVLIVDNVMRVYRLNKQEGYPYFVDNDLLRKILEDVCESKAFAHNFLNEEDSYAWDMITYAPVVNSTEFALEIIEKRNDSSSWTKEG